MFSVIQINQNKLNRKYIENIIKYIEKFRIEMLHLQLNKKKFRSSKKIF